MNMMNVVSPSVVWWAQASSGQSTLLSLVPMIAIFAIFYFLLVVPMRKRQKALQQVIDNLKKGDKVVTNSGIYGEIAALDANTNTLILKIADNVKIKVAKTSIGGLEVDGDKGGKE